MTKAKKKSGQIPAKLEPGATVRFVKPVERGQSKAAKLDMGNIEIEETIQFEKSRHHYYTDPDDGNVKRILEIKR